MREINARAWIEDSNKFIYFSVGEPIFQYQPSDIQLSTGLKDKNGKEIYEGDIVKSKLMGDGNEYEIWKIEILPTKAIDSPEGKAFDNSWIEHEIIGNIYENQELLK